MNTLQQLLAGVAVKLEQLIEKRIAEHVGGLDGRLSELESRISSLEDKVTSHPTSYGESDSLESRVSRLESAVELPGPQSW